MDGLFEFLLVLLGQPFTWGLLLGLGVAFYFWRSAGIQRKFLKQQLKKAEADLNSTHEHLDRQLKINARGMESVDRELEELRQQNLNLKEILAAYKQKPSGQERRALQVMDGAVRKMNERAPGFSAAWENCFREAEAEADQAESGVSKFVRRMVSGSFVNQLLPGQTQEEEATSSGGTEKNTTA